MIAQLQLPGYPPIPYPTGLKVSNFNTIGATISTFLPLIFTIAGLVLLILLISGGFQFLTSMGDPKAAQSAKEKLTSAFAGFIIIFVSYWIFKVIGIIIGIDIFAG